MKSIMDLVNTGKPFFIEATYKDKCAFYYKGDSKFYVEAVGGSGHYWDDFYIDLSLSLVDQVHVISYDYFDEQDSVSQNVAVICAKPCICSIVDLMKQGCGCGGL
jgi:hypothetical protein